MNRTLLLIICDFLLLNLLALTRWDGVNPAEKGTGLAGGGAGTPAEVAVDVGVRVENELVEAMKAALTDEQAARQDLTKRLEAEVADRDAALDRLEVQRQELEASLRRSRETATELASKLTNTLSAVTEAQAEVERREAQLAETRRTQQALAESMREASEERRRLQEALAAEIRRREDELASQREAAEALEKEKVDLERRTAQLDAAVRVAQAEKDLLTRNVDDLRQQVATVQEEKSRLAAQTETLASGVSQLAQSSQAIQQEIRENTPINANLVFGAFSSNRVQVRISGQSSGFLTSGLKQRESQTALVTDGTNVVALVHVDDAPFALSIPGFPMTEVRPDVRHDGRALPIGPVYFLQADPRVLGVPVGRDQAAAAGLTAFQVAVNPFRFPEAVLVSRGGKYYGEVEFRLDARTPGYVQMKRKILSRIFGEFSPSAGDLVLSKSGELLGVMANNEYCVVISSLLPAPGAVVDAGMPGETLARRLEAGRRVVNAMPPALQ